MKEDRRYGPDRRGDEFPEELARRETRLKKIQEAKRALEEKARKEVASKGKDAKPPDKAQRNFTDPDSAIRKTPDGYILPAKGSERNRGNHLPDMCLELFVLTA